MSEEREQTAADNPAAENEEVELEEQDEVEADEGEADEPDEGDGGGDAGSDEQAEAGQGPDGDARRAQTGRVKGERAAGRIQRLERERDDARARNDAFERQLQQLLSRESEADRRRREAEEAERIRMLPPEEQISYHINRHREETRTELQRTQFMLWNNQDQRSLDDIYERNPNYRKFNDKVEELHKQAPAVPRRMLLATAIGLAALDNAGSARTRQQKQAETAQRQQQTKAPGGRGNVAAPRERSGSRRGDWGHMRDIRI